jgi:hypothetical protein
MLKFHILDSVIHVPRAKSGIVMSYQDPLHMPYSNQVLESIILLPDWYSVEQYQSNTGRNMGPLLVH